MVIGPARVLLGPFQALVGDVGEHVHAARREPHEERVPGVLRGIHVREAGRHELLVHPLHPLSGQLPGVGDALPADLAEARVDGLVVDVGRPRVQHPAGPEVLLERRVGRVVDALSLLLGVEVVQVPEELVEAVNGGQVLVATPRWFLPNWPQR